MHCELNFFLYHVEGGQDMSSREVAPHLFVSTLTSNALNTFMNLFLSETFKICNAITCKCLITQC